MTVADTMAETGGTATAGRSRAAGDKPRRSQRPLHVFDVEDLRPRQVGKERMVPLADGPFAEVPADVHHLAAHLARWVVPAQPPRRDRR